jgi:H+-translocating NAD(P) transhydrogenase subunit beta
VSASMIQLTYLGASVLFILGLRGLTHPRTAVRGNQLGALGMFLAVIVTLVNQQIVGYEFIAAGILVGAMIGFLLATWIHMTAMPQLVALFNGFGGAASVLVAGAALLEAVSAGSVQIQTRVAIVASGLIGMVTFLGSTVAFVKLQELLFRHPIRTGMRFLNVVLSLGAIGAGSLAISDPSELRYFWMMVAIASVLGVTMTIPIGGADMPVVIALLNSMSGLAAAATGFVLNNSVLIVAGSLVGASGLILTQIMCKAMNRSLGHVLFGVIEATSSGGDEDIYDGRVKSTSAEEVAMLLESAQRVAIVPGYGMAVAQAQHSVRDLARQLQERGVDVVYAIHPVAGRMPGHMNVLLAEADVPYDQLVEMDVANPAFPQTDAVLVIGANDVVNPVAREDPDSPIAGMPILDVDKARTVIVIKRSLSPGFAGISNPLFAADNTLMLFGDGKAAVLDLVKALNES